MGTRVRAAALDDIDVLVAMGRELHAESPRYNVMSFNETKVRMLAQRLLTGTMTTDPVGGVFVAEQNGVVGMAAGFVSEHWFSDEKMLCDYTVYVRPGSRGSFAFVRLVGILEDWGRRQGARFSSIGVSTGINATGTRKMYERMGYKPSGNSLLKEL